MKKIKRLVPDTTQKYEYACQFFNSYSNIEDIVPNINKWAEEGWEVLQIIIEHNNEKKVVFKRKLTVIEEGIN